MKNHRPLISVVMPAFNAEKFIAEAIESILNQTFKDFEFIIVDDGSTDATWEIVQNYCSEDSRIIPLKNDKNLKLSKTLNKGINASSGKYIARMDADDISFPNRLKMQVQFMEDRPRVGILGGVMVIMSEDGVIHSKREYKTTDADLRKLIFRVSPFCHPAVLIRRSVLDKVGLYDHFYNPAEDLELYFRLGEQCEFANLPEKLIKYRILDSSMTGASLKKMELKSIEVRKKYFKSLSYRVSFVDKVYNTLHWLSAQLLPTRVKIYMFSFVRDTLVK